MSLTPVAISSCKAAAKSAGVEGQSLSHRCQDIGNGRPPSTPQRAAHEARHDLGRRVPAGASASQATSRAKPSGRASSKVGTSAGPGALGARHGERAQLVPLHRPKGRRHGGKPTRSGCRAAQARYRERPVRHVHMVDVGGQAERLGRQVRQAAEATRPVVQLAGFRLGQLRTRRPLAGDDGGTTINDGMRVIIVMGTKLLATS